uniref:Leucine-rich repeat-containing N-terminal plant-type domain-containing protein n=1 Tax=Kalanchoe fedtschenkoi TaxID=63787 RepID=A0A7N0TQI6_KALFE
MTTLHIKLPRCVHITLLSLLSFFSICGGSTELVSNPPPMTRVRCVELERQALMRIKAAFTDPHGNLSSWTGQDCCSSWAGVACSNITGQVEKLDLSFASLTGDLSSSLTDLKYLTYLDLSYNDFQNKTIPEFIGSMESLTYLDMSCSLFGGVIPRQLGNLRNLVELRLDYAGCLSIYLISELSWVSSLSSLERLEIARVNLSLASQHWLQSVNMLPNLKSLVIHRCKLAYLPQTLPFVNFSSLTYLDLSFNKFNSLIPTWLSNTSSLEDIVIEHSGLISRIPSLAFENMCNLQEIWFTDNLLDGGLAELVDALADCSNSSIQVLDLRNNKLRDYLPNSLGRLRNLNHLYVSSNSLLGSIPASIGNLTKLRVLGICDNQWQGVMRDAHLSNLVNLTFLSIGSSNKSLVLDFSADWYPPFNLSYLYIFDCQIGASFPAWIESQTNLNVLTLSKTGVSGVLPNWIWKLSTQLENLDLSHNKLHGNLPEMLMITGRFGQVDLGNNLFEGTVPRLGLSNISTLSLKNNRLSGVMPSDMFDQQPSHLRYLDLSGNMLSGNIPTKLNTMEALMYLDFSSNNLSGEVPETLCLLPSLVWLKLSNNSLSGEPCNSVTAFDWLTSIDLGENNFSGNIPKWRGDSLEEIRLHGNFFKGSLPAELCSLPNLHVLDMARNKLSGQIPSCFGKMTGFRKSLSNFYGQLRSLYQIEMELNVKGSDLIFDTNLPLLNLIDLSGNELSGQIPEQITNLSYLNCLNLSGNKINGHIPDNMGLLLHLESLDLSNNALDGHIPTSLASITFLSKLNLSHNNLSGQIPSQYQFLTFDPSIYEGNPGLWGLPLPKMCNPHKSDKNSSDDSDFWEKMTCIVSEKMMLWTSIVLGFIFGFWAVCGTLAVKKSWRDAYFRFLGI